MTCKYQIVAKRIDYQLKIFRFSVQGIRLGICELALVRQVAETADCLKAIVKYTKNKPLSGRSVLAGGYSYVEGSQEVTS